MSRTPNAAMVVRRAAKRAATRRGQRKPPPPVEDLFTTDLTLSPQDILAESSKRWAVGVGIRDANAFDGIGQDQCRKRQRVIGANTLRFVLASLRTLWFIAQVDRGTQIPLCRSRVWYRQKVAQVDSTWRRPVERLSVRSTFSHTAVRPCSGRKSRGA